LLHFAAFLGRKALSDVVYTQIRQRFATSAFGGGNRDRTCDLLNANQMLSQLSYAPKIAKAGSLKEVGEGQYLFAD
jgi:hypothetical protein